MANVYHIALVIWSMIETYSVRLHMKDSFQMLLLWQLLMKKKWKENIRSKRDQVSNGSTTTKQHRLWSVNLLKSSLTLSTET